MQRVQVARDNGADVEIASGLQAGDILVVNPGDEIDEGTIVTPAKTGALGASGQAASPGRISATGYRRAGYYRTVYHRYRC